MAAQSRPPILITRPEPQATRFARALRQTDWTGRVHVSPLMAADYAEPEPPDRAFSALILTSETAALSAGRLRALGRHLPNLAWCVGDRTAAVARRLGFLARSAQGDVTALRAALLASHQPGPLLYLHGRDIATDLAESLNSAGLETFSIETYAQNPRPLTPAAQRLLTTEGPVLLPIFSPRTATLLAATTTPRAPLHIIALSPAVAKAAAALHPASLVTASHPDGDSLLQALHQVAISLHRA